MKSIKLLFAGGDKRRDYIEEYLAKRGYGTLVYENDPDAYFKELPLENTAVVLPLPVSRDGKTVNITENAPPLYLDRLTSGLKSGGVVFGGMISAQLSEKLSDKGVTVIDYYDEDVIRKNAVVTAECLLTVLSENGVDAESAKFAVTGFGRVGKAVCELFKKRNYNFYAVMRSNDALNVAKSMNFEAVKLSDFTEKTPFTDVIVNTVPALILDENILKTLKKGAIIIDLASYPYGVNLALAECFGVKTVRALSLPGKYSPARAGIIIGERLESLLQGR